MPDTGGEVLYCAESLRRHYAANVSRATLFFLKTVDRKKLDRLQFPLL